MCRGFFLSVPFSALCLCAFVPFLTFVSFVVSSLYFFSFFQRNLRNQRQKGLSFRFCVFPLQS